MPLIRVNPESIRAYGAEAQALFDGMHQSLVQMVNDVVAVRYYGPNAVAFKTECGRMAAEFANKLHLDLAAMADAVSRSTSNIAASLGGTPVVVRVDPKPIAPPAPEVVDYVDVDTGALEAQIPAVTSRFGELRQQLSANLHKLSATDWEGNAKAMAVDEVGRFTTTAIGKCDEAQRSLSDFMRRQVDAVLAADR
jgi:hypothetical protein